MRFSAVLLGLAGTAACSAIPFEVSFPSASAPCQTVDSTTQLEPRDGIDNLQWSGSLYEGGPVVEYSGEDLDVSHSHRSWWKIVDGLTRLQDIDAKVQKDYPGLSIFGAPEAEPETGTSSFDDDPAFLAERDLSKRVSLRRFDSPSSCL